MSSATVFGILGAVLSCGPGAGDRLQESLPSAPPQLAKAHPAVPAPSAPIEIPSVDPTAAQDPDPVGDLLGRLEQSAEDLRTFQANITFITWDAVLERKLINTGLFFYEVREGSKRIAIRFDRLIIDDRLRKQNKHYVFDRGWFIEIDHAAKTIIKHQVVAPGERFDPLRLGEGPFPLPIGQPKEQVLARFVVTPLARSDNDWLAERIAGRRFDGLLLVPKPGTPEAKDHSRVEVFYDRRTLLPVGVHATETDHDTKTVYLGHLKRNEGIDQRVFEVDKHDPKEGWRIDSRPWKDLEEG